MCLATRTRRATGLSVGTFSGGQGVYLRYIGLTAWASGDGDFWSACPDQAQGGVGAVTQPRPLCSRVHDVAVELRDPLAKEWVSKRLAGSQSLDFGERARDWLLAHADQFDVVHDNQTLADGILDLQRAGPPVVTTIHHITGT